MAGGGLSFDLMDQLAFYGAYHSHPVNKAIHFVFVPAIVWATLVWLASFGPLAPLPAWGPLTAFVCALPPWLARGVSANVPAVMAALYSAFYLSLDAPAGLSWAVCIGLPLAVTATAFQAQVANAARWALGVQIVSWYAQIHPGHAIFEGRKPALLDSLLQAFLLAPLFVWFEALFALGYKPWLRAALQERVAADIAAWKRGQKDAGRGRGRTKKAA